MTDALPLTIRGRRTPLDYIFFLRPVLLPPVWTIALLGTVGGPASGAMSTWRWLAFFLHLTCLYGGVYTLNQIRDIESDRRNRKLFFLPEGIIPPRAAWGFTAAVDLAALLLSVRFGRWHVVLTVMVMALGVAYSVGRRPWKNRPWLGFLANALGHGPLVYLLGQTAFSPSAAIRWCSSIPYFFAVGAVFLATTIPDVAGDRASGKTTASVVLGGRSVMAAATMLVLASTVLAAALGDYRLAVAAVVALPVFVWSTAQAGEYAAGAAKAGVGFLSIAAVVAYPLYLILLLTGFVATRLFFRWRFGVTYPTLSARG
jgi:4-hydroxybenzoate polyprenyltransferase